jgi:hypothetical protein
VHALGSFVVIVLVVESTALQPVYAQQTVVVQEVVSVDSGVAVLARQKTVQLDAVSVASQLVS